MILTWAFGDSQFLTNAIRSKCGYVHIYWCTKKIFMPHFLLVTSGNLGCTSRVCLSLSLASPIGHPIKNKTSPTVSLSSLTSSTGNLRKKLSPTMSHSSLSFHRNKRTASYANTAVFISVQTGQNLHESISTFYKSHPPLQECFLTSHAKHVLARFGFCGKSFCYILTFDPAKNAIPRWCTGRKWHILMAVMRGNRVGGNWLMKWDKVKKFPWYTHRLMHRKRVTCELHDSYFHLMTIQHAIPKSSRRLSGRWTII